VVDHHNLTGYSQIVEELDATGAVVATYHYGHDLISQSRLVVDPATGSSEWVDRLFVYDGGGSVRALTDLEGNVTDTFSYDAYGNLLQPSSLFLPTSYLYRGERYDPDLGHYYLRARFYDANLGRFHTLDEYEGRTGEPLSLHKYLYAHANPVSGWDPSGNETLPSQTVSQMVQGTLRNMGKQNYKLVIRKGVCQLIEIGLDEATEAAINTAGLYLFEHAYNVPNHLGKGGKPYVGRSHNIYDRIAEHSSKGRVGRVLARIHVDPKHVKEAEQWMIEVVKKSLYQDIKDPLGRSNAGNKLANRRNEVKALIGKALPMCK